MRIHVREDATARYMRRTYKGVRSSEWCKTLTQVEGTWLDVETEFLFRDQFNTVPIDGISESGLRIMLEDIDAIEDDVRQDTRKCFWCGTMGTMADTQCPKCSKTAEFRPFNPKSPPEMVAGASQ